MNTVVYNSKGEKAGKIDLPDSIFGVSWNADLVHQVVMAMQANKRSSTAHTKDRSEVAGGGKKPWKQKGTGRARHGSTRSPIWRKGGITFGPRSERDYSQKINKKMKVQALYTVLSQKLRDGEVLLVDSLSFDKPKTKEARSVLVSLSKAEGLKNLSTKRKNAAYIGVSKYTDSVSKSFRNIKSVKVDSFKNINPVELLTHKFVIIENPEEAVSFLESKNK